MADPWLVGLGVAAVVAAFVWREVLRHRGRVDLRRALTSPDPVIRCGALRGLGTSVNVVQFVGHGALRYATVGGENRPPTADEQTAIRRERYIRSSWMAFEALQFSPTGYLP